MENKCIKHIEADEVVVRKKTLPATWFSGMSMWASSRGPSLEERAKENTVTIRAKAERPGKKGKADPPPLKSEEWVAVAKGHVKDKTILHVDGAVAYASKVDRLEIRRDTVDHGCRHGVPYHTQKGGAQRTYRSATRP